MVTAFGEAIDGVDMVWDVTDPSRPRRLSQFEGGQPLALSPDGRTVATIAYSGQTALWNVTDPAHAYRMATLGGAGDFVQAFTFSPDGNLLAAVTFHGTVLVYSLVDPTRPAPPAPPRSAAC